MSEAPSTNPKDPGNVLDSVFNAQIGKIVAFALTPLLAIAIPPLVNAVNSVLGTDFSDQQISNIAIAAVVGVAIVIWQWLRNRGEWEKTLAGAKVLYEQNQAVSLPEPRGVPLPGTPTPVQQGGDVIPPPSSSALGMQHPPE